MKKREEFSKKYFYHPWNKVLFTDEKFFSLTPPYNPKNDVIWGEKGDRNDVCRWRSKGVNVWAGISSMGKTDLVFLEGKQDSENYIKQCLAPELRKFRLKVGRRTWWLQQDGARKHTSRKTMEWFRKNVRSFIPPKDWPPNSPDLSCIENLWGNIENEVWKEPPKTIKQMKKRLQIVWNSLKNRELKNYTESTRSRLQECIDLKGRRTSY